MDWFYRTIDGNLGPIDTEQFLLAVQNRIVVPQTLVRHADQSEWMLASEIEGLVFPGESLSGGAPSVAGPTSPHPSNVDMKRLFVECLEQKQAKSPPPKHQPLERASSPLAENIASGFSSVTSYFSDLVASLCAGIASFTVFVLKQWIVWAAGIVVVLALLAYPLLQRPAAPEWTQRDIYTSLKQTFEEWKELRAEERKADDWDEFKQRTETLLTELKPILKRDARIEDRASMSLMWIARDFFPVLLRDRSVASSELEQKITSHLEVAELVFRKPARQPSPRRSMAIPIITGLIAVVAIGLILYLGRTWYMNRFAMR